MLGSIYIGLSGMNAYAKGLQTIGNNVANLNSSGFKSVWANFSDAFSFGGGNSGGGVQFLDPRTNFQQGELRQSSSDLDLAIQGEGFLALLNGDQASFARTGQFFVDEDGFITLQGTEYHLCVLDESRQPIELNLDARRTDDPAATTTISFSGNLASGAEEATSSNITIYDAAGGKHVWKVKFAAVGETAPGEWEVTVLDESGGTVGESTLKFIGGIVDPTTSRLTITSGTGDGAQSVELDFSSGFNSWSSGDSTINVDEVDGHGVGALTNVTVDDTGQVKLTYSNGETELLGYVAMADFKDQQMLEHAGNGLFQNRGGDYRMMASGSDGVGKLMSRRLEASNVDLSQQFGDLILVQRGFQASSQVVSVSNDMIQQLFGIQGR